MKYKIILVAIIFSLALATGASADWRQRSFLDLEAYANAIVVGSARIVVQTSSTVKVEITVNRSLKGALKARDKVTATWLVKQISPTQNTDGLWFLKANEYIGWEILPTANGDVGFERTHLPASSGDLASDFSYKADTPITDKIVYELGAEVERSRLEVKNLGTEEKPFLTMDPEAMKLRDLFMWVDEWVRPSDPALLPRLYTRFASSSIPGVKAIGLRGLIKRGNYEPLVQVANDRAMLKALGQEIAFTDAISSIRTPSLTLFGALNAFTAEENSIYLRHAAAYALKAIHTKDTLPYLVQLLDSNDIQLRLRGAAGLAAFANNLPIESSANYINMNNLKSEPNASYKTQETERHFPSVDAFIKDESKYIEFWKNWWQTNQASLSESN